MTPQYAKRVKEKFEEIKSSGKLSRRLLDPTLASIRDECLAVYQKGVTKEDESIVANFFSHEGVLDKLSETIDRVELDDLKALQNFILGETKRPNYRVVEMLAWLIDFERRPYNPTVDYSLATDSNVEGKSHTDIPIGVQTGINVESENGKGSLGHKSSNKWKIVTLASAVSLILAIIAYQLFYKGQKSNQLTLSKGCMYWNGVKYIRTDCDTLGRDVRVLPIPKTGIPDLEKVTRPDTITHYSVGKLYCIKIGEEYEYYTSDGVYPLDTTKDLKKLSAYIVNNHLLNNKNVPANLGLKSN
jgi:hypothetical protein